MHPERIFISPFVLSCFAMNLDLSYYSLTLLGVFAGISSGLLVKLYKVWSGYVKAMERGDGQLRFDTPAISCLSLERPTWLRKNRTWTRNQRRIGLQKIFQVLDTFQLGFHSRFMETRSLQTEFLLQFLGSSTMKPWANLGFRKTKFRCSKKCPDHHFLFEIW